MEVSIQVRTWAEAREALVAVREEVYVREQAVPVALEWDGLDQHSLHVIAEVDGKAVGVGRLHAEEHRARLGRMAVRKDWRGMGVGAALLDTLLVAARELGLTEAFLHAQTRAVGFYETRGFVAHGEEFEDAGIPHREMKRDLP